MTVVLGTDDFRQLRSWNGSPVISADQRSLFPSFGNVPSTVHEGTPLLRSDALIYPYEAALGHIEAERQRRPRASDVTDGRCHVAVAPRVINFDRRYLVSGLQVANRTSRPRHPSGGRLSASIPRPTLSDVLASFDIPCFPIKNLAGARTEGNVLT